MGRKNRDDYLSDCADILCKSAYELCSQSFKAKNSAIDAKGLKDACAAVKEAISIASSLDSHFGTGAAFSITIENEAKQLSV